MNRFQRVIEKVLRPGTRRRRFYELGLTGSRVILNKGWGSFWFEVKGWRKKLRIIQKYDPYQQWIVPNEPSIEEYDIYKQESLSFSLRPKISIILQLRNTSDKWLGLTIESILNQIYDNWELCLVCSKGLKRGIKDVLQEYADKDKRIKIKITDQSLTGSRAFNEALSMTDGQFIALMEADDELAPFALYEVMKLLNKMPDLDYIYSDEDGVTNINKRVNPFLKPDWSPDMLLSCFYTGQFSIYRKTIVDNIGGFREGYDHAEHYDLTLRFVENTTNIFHISKVLYHNRIHKTHPKAIIEVTSTAHNSGRKALEDYLMRNDIKGDVLNTKWRGYYRVRRKIHGNPLVSIIIPAKDGADFLKACVQSVINKTEYKNYEIIIVDNESQEARTLKYFDKLKKNPRIRIIEYDKTFNFSAINNFASAQANGDYLLFLHSDTRIISREWLSALLEHAQRKEVGAVGCLLLYANKRIQHAGIMLGSNPLGRHSHRHIRVTEPGYFLRPHLVHNLSAVTAACMLLSKQVFQEVGGFDECLPIIWNDIDICLNIREKGWLIVYTPYAKLYHSECPARGRDSTAEKQTALSKFDEYITSKWRRIIEAVDPYYNPGLTEIGEDFAFKSWIEMVIGEEKFLSAADIVFGNRLINWLRESVASNKNNPIPGLWYELYTKRPDLKKAFPDVKGAHRGAFLKWVSTVGRLEYPACDPRGSRRLMEIVKKANDPTGYGINVSGYITGDFGVGAGSRSVIQAIKAAGIPCVLNNIVSPIHSGKDSTYCSFSNNNPYPVNLIHVNADQAFESIMRTGLAYFIGKYNIGYWMWEMSRFPEEWYDSFKYYDEIWVPTNFVLESIKKVSPIPVNKIFCFHIDETNIDINRSKFGLPEDTCVFLFNFDFHSYFQRKNPLALVKAFRQAFDKSDKVLLLLKYINQDYHPLEIKALQDAISGIPNIKVIDTNLKKDDLYSLVNSCDCYVSLHRSEGFGLTIAEAMYLKKPVIATGYSGNMDFMDMNNSFLVKYKLIDVEPNAYPPYSKGYVWADPDVEHAAELMRFVYLHRDYATELGKIASEDIKRRLSPAVAGQEIRSRLEAILRAGKYK